MQILTRHRPETKPLQVVSILHGSRDVAGILSERLWRPIPGGKRGRAEGYPRSSLVLPSG